MADLISAFQIVLYILAGYSAIAILHAPFYWLAAKTVWDERRAEVKEILSRRRDGSEEHAEAWEFADYMSHAYDLESEYPPWRFRREAALVQSIAWPVSDACWLAHWMNGAR